MGYRWTAAVLQHPAVVGGKVYVFDQRADDPDWIEGKATYVGGPNGLDVVVEIEGGNLVEANVSPQFGARS